MLEFRNITIKYGNTIAVDNLSLTVRAGELMTLLGPSGCGKTTLLRTAGGFLTPFSGHVWLDGKDVTDLPPESRATATVFQSHALFPHKNVGQNVAYGLRAKGVPKARAAAMAAGMLEKVGLAGTENRPVQALSGGQQQRVALARALVINPKVLLLDEPLSSLDAGLRVRLREEIRRIQQDLGMTALYVTHDREEALSISDQVTVMCAGRLMQAGTPDEIYAQPQNEFVARFVGDANVLQSAEDENLYVRPGQLTLLRRGRHPGRVTERQFKGEVVTYILKMDADIPDLPVATGQGEKYARVAGQQLRVDVPTPEEHPFAPGEWANVGVKFPFIQKY